jgi:hypothetical protein
MDADYCTMPPFEAIDTQVEGSPHLDQNDE